MYWRTGLRGVLQGDILTPLVFVLILCVTGALSQSIPGNPTITAPSSALEGSTVNFTCSSVGGNPLPTVTWIRGSNIVDQSYSTSSLGSTTLTTNYYIFAVYRNDSGVSYRCEVDNVNLGSPLTKTWFLTVYVQPGAPVINGSSDLTAGSTYTHRCHTPSGGIPVPTLNWRLGSQSPDNLAISNKITTLNDNTNIVENNITWVPVASDNGKTLSCELSHNETLGTTRLIDSFVITIQEATTVETTSTEESTTESTSVFTTKAKTSETSTARATSTVDLTTETKVSGSREAETTEISIAESTSTVELTTESTSVSSTQADTTKFTTVETTSTVEPTTESTSVFITKAETTDTTTTEGTSTAEPTTYSMVSSSLQTEVTEVSTAETTSVVELTTKVTSVSSTLTDTTEATTSETTATEEPTTDNTEVSTPETSSTVELTTERTSVEMTEATTVETTSTDEPTTESTSVFFTTKAELTETSTTKAASTVEQTTESTLFSSLQTEATEVLTAESTSTVKLTTELTPVSSTKTDKTEATTAETISTVKLTTGSTSGSFTKAETTVTTSMENNATGESTDSTVVRSSPTESSQTYSVTTVFPVKDSQAWCDISTGSRGTVTKCLKVTNFDGYQTATCLSLSEVKSRSNYTSACADECRGYCFLSCMTETYGISYSNVYPDCACSPIGGEDSACYNPQGECTFFGQCLKCTNSPVTDLRTQCQWFSSNILSFSDCDTRNWIRETRLCFQRYYIAHIETSPPTDCAIIADYYFYPAFDYCLTDAVSGGLDFCGLNAADKSRIYNGLLSIYSGTLQSNIISTLQWMNSCL